MDPALISHLEPICQLSPGRQKEIADLCFVESVSKDIDPFRLNVVKNSQSLYLLRGELGLKFENDAKLVLRAGSDLARYPVGGNGSAKLKLAVALTDIDIVRIDTDLLDIMMTWDQLSDYERSSPRQQETKPSAPAPQVVADWMKQTGIFSAGNLQSGVFSRLPPANIDEMFRRMVNIPVKAGETVIHQGDEGDYYYMIDTGTADVTRVLEPGAAPVLLAQLRAGDAFGEEALVSDNQRNATVTMKTDGVLMRLNKQDFVELLKAPLLNRISRAAADKKVDAGAIWLDVRFPSEFQFGHLPGAINAPLHDIRSALASLDPHKTYICYCQTGRRSSAAAFIMAQNGLRAYVLDGGASSSNQA